VGPASAEVFEDRFANFILNWILLDTTMLGTAHDEGFASPVEIVEAKSRDLAASQAIDGIQQNHRSCS
jgi:hypothetical protein